MFLFLALASASAQVVTVEVRLESEQYLPDEPLIARVRISNASGQTLRLGDDPNWLTFMLESSEGPYVRQLRPLDVVGGFDLESSETATKRVDLAPYFNLSEMGRYKAVATVKVAKFNASYASAGKVFYITNGKKLREIPFGVPPNIATSGEKGEPEQRKYILVEALTGLESKTESRLYVRLTDRAERNMRVIPIGTLISFSRPEPQIDKWGNLHLIFQTGARSFSYTMINADGFVVARESHEYTDTRPKLVSSDEGRIYVKGGYRRFTVDDVPPVDTAQVSEQQAAIAAANVLPPVTNAPPSKKSKKTADAKKKP